MSDREDDKIQKREAEDEASKAIQMSYEDIIKEIHYCATVPPPYGDSTSLKKSLAYFSSLLYKLAKQAEESTNKTVNLTNKIHNLTWFIAILTAVLLFVGILQLTK